MILVIVMDTTPKIKRSIKTQFRNCIPYVEFIDWNTPSLIEKITRISPDGIILSGSTSRISASSPTLPSVIFDIGIPILGICYGYQLITRMHIGKRGTRSYLDLFECPVDIKISKPFQVPMLIYKLSHHDDVVKTPPGWHQLVQKGFESKQYHSDEIPGFYEPRRKHMGIIFHPEKRKATGSVFFQAWQKWIMTRS